VHVKGEKGSASQSTSTTPTPAASVDASTYTGKLPALENLASEKDLKITYPEGYTVPDDLVVKVLENGTGEVVSPATGEIEVAYTGWNIKGNVFDSSIQKDKTFKVKNDVIPGWKQGLNGKKVGDKLMLVIPQSLAYTDNGVDLLEKNPFGPGTSCILCRHQRGGGGDKTLNE
jgi:peptidylprolyl isomerase